MEGMQTFKSPKISVIMGSSSDWKTMKNACDILREFEISFEKKIVSAHRTPMLMVHFAKEAKNRGVEVIIAGAGGAAHLPGMVSSLTSLPVLGVPILSKSLNGIDSLLSIVQMPSGVPVGTLAIGAAGAKNAAILAIRILALKYDFLHDKLDSYREGLEVMSLNGEKEII